MVCRVFLLALVYPLTFEGGTLCGGRSTSDENRGLTDGWRERGGCCCCCVCAERAQQQHNNNNACVCPMDDETTTEATPSSSPLLACAVCVSSTCVCWMERHNTGNDIVAAAPQTDDDAALVFAPVVTQPVVGETRSLSLSPNPHQQKVAATWMCNT